MFLSLTALRTDLLALIWKVLPAGFGSGKRIHSAVAFQEGNLREILHQVLSKQKVGGLFDLVQFLSPAFELLV